MKHRRVLIRDETLRDGLQQYGLSLTATQKVKVAKICAKLLVTPINHRPNIIDLGMPEVSHSSKKLINKIIKSIASYNVDMFVTGRAIKSSIDHMTDVFSGIGVNQCIIAPFIGVSEFHRKKMGMNKREVIDLIRESVLYSQKKIKRIHFPLEGAVDLFLEDKKYFAQIINELDKLKVEAVNICDTSGKALPIVGRSAISYGDVIKFTKRHHPRLLVSVHCHDDLGLAVANSLSGLISGADIVDGTFFGVGERAGNTSLQTILVILNEKVEELGIEIVFQHQLLGKSSDEISRLLDINPTPNAPIIGSNAFIHSSGIHQDGVLKHPELYRPYDPEKYGIRGHKIKLSYMSGINGIDYFLRSDYKLSLSRIDLNSIIPEFKEFENTGGNPEETLLRLVLKYMNNQEHKNV